MDTASGKSVGQTSRSKLIAVIGNPNSGKTTVFNQLTGLRQKVGNYPGVTVEQREGVMAECDGIRLLDLPGCYSLTPRSLDERVARDTLLGWMEGVERPCGVIIILDAANLERNLFLATQVLELNLPTIMVCNMLDLVERRGDRIDLQRLGDTLGVGVVGTIASKGEGIGELRSAIASLDGQLPQPRGWSGSTELDSAVREVGEVVRSSGLAEDTAAESVAMLLLAPAVLNEADASHTKLPEVFRQALDGLHRKYEGGTDGQTPLASEAVQARYRWLSDVVSDVLHRGGAARTSLSDRIDRWATHKVWGLALFGALMLAMFIAIFSWATPLMDGIDWLIASLSGLTASLLPEGMVTDLLVDGVIGGVGNVLVFFPQICILFFFIALLEDSGYMARVAFVMDRIMVRVGLHGKSCIPLMSCFACAIPGIMACRTIEDRRDRLVTILIAPFMSCSARLPVYILMVSVLFGSSVWMKTGVIVSMYALGILAALLTAMLFKRTVLKGPTPVFIMELPPYHIPRLSSALRHMWERSKYFLSRAGTIILALTILLWALAYFPRAPESMANEPGTQLRQSYIGRVGRIMEPVIQPLGFDWKMGVGLASSFAAREVFVATMAVVYGLDEGADEQSGTLRQRIAAATWPDGRKVYTPLVGITLMVFYVLSCQCMSTLVVVYRETRSWRWPALMFSYMTIVAYVASFLVYQGGKVLGLS